MEPVSRQQAKAQTLMYYYTGKPCTFGHVTKRRTSNSTCYECELHTSKKTRDPETKIQYDAKYHKQNWPRMYRENKPKYFARSAVNRARRKQALASWYHVEQTKVQRLYKLAQQITENTGVPHHVDHIVPISNEAVCGLHCYANLQILSAEDNQKKSNKFKN